MLIEGVQEEGIWGVYRDIYLITVCGKGVGTGKKRFWKRGRIMRRKEWGWGGGFYVK